MIVGAIIGGSIAAAAGSLGAAAIGASAANNATSAAQSEFNTANAEAAPSRALAAQADKQLEQLFGNSATGQAPNYSGFENSPGFQFSLGLGQQAINRSQAANGGLYAPGTATLESQYTTGFANQNYNNYVNSLLTAAGLGTQSTNATQSAAATTGQTVAGTIQNAGNAQASGVAAASGALSSGIGAAVNANTQQNILNSALTGNPAYQIPTIPNLTSTIGTPNFTGQFGSGGVGVNVPQSLPSAANNQAPNEL